MAWRRKPVPDPEPGIGGYDYPRGPAGESGYPGSTSARRENPEAAESRLHDNYNGSKPRRRFQAITYQQSRFNRDNWDIDVNPDRVRDTEIRNHKDVSGRAPGGERVRNQIYRGGLEALPGVTREYYAAPNPGIAGKRLRSFLSTRPAKTVSRFKHDGVNGGLDLYQDTLSKRRMPYTGQDGYRGNLGHARGGIRGAVNDGTRFYRDPNEEFLMQGGAYGKPVRGHQRHRPTIYREPSSKNSKFYDTTADVGTPTQRGGNTHVTDAVHVSPQVGSRRNRGF